MLLTIDFLILNFKGTLKPSKRCAGLTDDTNTSPFNLTRHEYGNKTFTDVYDIFYKNERLGVVNAVPRSSIIASDLIQFQFENHLFYTLTLHGLGQLVYNLVDYFDVTFEGVNRLDIAVDTKPEPLFYHELYSDLLTGKKLLKGREKALSAHSLTNKGRGQFNGFTVGKRSSARFLRIYNKSEALRQPKQPKPYITEWHEKNGLNAQNPNDIWRFEYQLNSRFFTDMRKYGKNITFQIFELESLIELLEFAQKNHFEVVENTGKTETNKENAIPVLDWELIRSMLRNAPEYHVSKLKRAFEPSITVHKRTIKGLFRMYYLTQSIVYLDPLTQIVNQWGFNEWFISKYPFYLREFAEKEKLKSKFCEQFFINRFETLTA